MKNRVYKIKDKILVQGNENELTKDEVLVKEENGSVVLKERVNGEVKDIVVKGGSDTPTATLILNGEVTVGAAQQVAEWAISISEEIRNQINSSTMPILIKGVIINEVMGTVNYEINLLRNILMVLEDITFPTYSGSFTIQRDGQSLSLAAIVVPTETGKLQIITCG